MQFGCSSAKVTTQSFTGNQVLVLFSYLCMWMIIITGDGDFGITLLQSFLQSQL